MKDFELQIISPEKVIMKGSARSLVLPAYEGKLGVLAGHAPMLLEIMPGELEVKVEEPKDVETVLLFSVSGGFAEITPRRTRIFVETAEMAAEIDEERTRLAVERAKKQILEKSNVAAAKAALQMALSRLKVASKIRAKARRKII